MDPEVMEQMKKLPPEELAKIIEKMMHNENNNPWDILARMTKKAKEEAGGLSPTTPEWNGSKEYDTSY